MNKIKIFSCIVALLICAGAILTVFCRPFNKVMNRREIVVTVTDKEVKNKNNDSKYLVYTKDKNGKIFVLEITDSLFALQFDSSDIYAGIEVGCTYKFSIGGSRNKFLSWYPNIYKYNKID